MNGYQVHLMLEALCQVHSLDALVEGTQIKKSLRRYLRLSEADAETLVEGALLLKHLRHDEEDVSDVYVH